MSGTQAEQAVLGTIIFDSRRFEFVKDVLAGDDFSDGRMGALYTGIANALARQEHIDTITIHERFLEWGVLGIDPSEPHAWVTQAPAFGAVGEYAQKVRDDAVRRRLTGLARATLEDLESNRMEIGQLVAKTAERIREIRDGVSIKHAEVPLLREIYERPEPDYDWVIPNLFERGDRLMLTAGEGAGKSTLLRQIAILSNAGIHPFRFTRIDPVQVLYIDAENSERQWRRASRSIANKAAREGVRDPQDHLRLECTKRIEIKHERDLGKIHRMIDEYRPDMVVIGPLYRLTGGAINNDDDASPILSALDSIRDRGIVLMMEAHAGLGKEGAAGSERDLRPRGSSALMGWPEFGFGLRANRQDANGNLFDMMRWRGDREERDWPIQLERGGPWPWTPIMRATAPDRQAW